MSATETQIGGSHYKDMAIQPAEFITRNNLDYLQGNVIKYVCRHKLKNGRQDIDKAIHYLHLILELQYPAITNDSKPDIEPDMPVEPAALMDHVGEGE